MKNKKQQEVLLERLLLLMSYDNKKTYGENLSKIKKSIEEQTQQNDKSKDNLFINNQLITIPGGRTIKIPMWEGTNTVPCSYNKEFWEKVALEKNVPTNKRKLFLDTINKIYKTPNAICGFSTPQIGQIPKKDWVVSIQWPTAGDKSYQPSAYYFSNKVGDDYYNEVDYIKIRKGKTDVAPKELKTFTKGVANPNIGVEGPIVDNKKLTGHVLNVDSVDKNYYIKWRIFNNSTKPMEVNNINVTELPIQYDVKVFWDKKKILEKNGDFLDVNLELIYKKEEGSTEAPKKPVGKGIASGAENSINKSQKLKEQTEEENESKLTPFEGKITLPFQFFTLNIDTNLGKTTQNVIVEETPDVKFKTTQKVLVDRAVKRKSIYNEVDVPEGYSPFTYDEFLMRKKEWNDFILKWGESTPSGKVITPTVYKNMPSDVKKYYDELKDRLRKLGFDPKFPKGITPEDKEIFLEKKNKLEKELSELKSKLKELMESYYSESTDAMGGTSGFYSSSMYEDKDYIEMNKRIKELEEELNVNKYQYGYDDRNYFDKFWDDYGLAINIGLAILTAALTFGASAPASTGFIASMLVRAGVTAEIAEGMSATAKALTAIDTYMNVGLGTYFAIKGDGLNAIMSLFFALLPKIHTLYGKIADYFGPKISKETAIRLQQIFSNAVIRNQDDLNGIISTLSNAEKRYVYSFMKMPNNVMSEALQIAQKNMDDIAKAEGQVAAQQLKVDLSTSSSMGKSLLKGGTMIGIDYLIIKNMEHMYDAVIASINCYCRGKKGKPCTKNQVETQVGMKGTIKDFEKYKYDCLVSEEERRKWKSYLSALTPAELQNLVKLLQFVAERTSPDKNFSIQQGIVKHGVTTKTLNTLQNITVEDAKKKFKEKGVDPNKVADDFIKQLEEELKSGQKADISVDELTNGKVKDEDLNNLNKSTNNNIPSEN